MIFKIRPHLVYLRIGKLVVSMRADEEEGIPLFSVHSTYHAKPHHRTMGLFIRLGRAPARRWMCANGNSVPHPMRKVLMIGWERKIGRPDWVKPGRAFMAMIG